MQLLLKQQYVEIAKEVELSKKKQLEDDQQIWQCILFLRISAIWQLLNKYKTQKAAGLDYGHPKLYLKRYHGFMLLNPDSCPRIRALEQLLRNQSPSWLSKGKSCATKPCPCKARNASLSSTLNVNIIHMISFHNHPLHALTS